MSDSDQPGRRAHDCRIGAVDDLYGALVGITDLYVRLADSGDCGFWNPEGVIEVISARAALAKAGGKT